MEVTQLVFLNSNFYQLENLKGGGDQPTLIAINISCLQSSSEHLQVFAGLDWGIFDISIQRVKQGQELKQIRNET